MANYAVSEQGLSSQPPQYKIPERLQSFIKSPNIASSLDDEELLKIGEKVCKGVKTDEDSREEWMKQLNEAMKIAKQVKERKNSPWPGAACVKYPGVLTACIQFNARTNPEATKDDKAVFVDNMKPNPTEDEENLARRLSSHMSYQLLGVSDHWRSDTDRLLMILPMVGTVFRKSYWNELDQLPDTELCIPDDIVVNNKAKSLESAQRITHKMYFTDNDLVERMRLGVYTTIDLEDLDEEMPDHEQKMNPDEDRSGKEEDGDELGGSDKLHLIYEQHRFLDLDGDGYAEPYIVVVHAPTRKVLRVVARYNTTSFIFSEKSKKFVKIKPIHYFTDYHFIPSPDGDFYSLGFGRIIYPLNETINTILNQLLDAGTLANRPSGFIGKQLRLRKQKIQVAPGEWKQLDATGTDIKNNIVPLPIKEPSAALFQLLSLMMKTVEEISTVSDVMQGQSPGANTSPTTVLSLIEQGNKVFSAILYRLYEAFKKEYEKLFWLNRTYLRSSQFYKSSIGSGMIDPGDYLIDEVGIFPIANPNMSTEAQRIAKGQALMQLKGEPGVNNYEITKRWLDTLRIPDPDKIIQKPNPNAPPPPEAQKMMAEIEKIKMESSDLLTQRELEAIRLELDEKRLELEKVNVDSNSRAQEVSSVVQLSQLGQTASEGDIQKGVSLDQSISQLVEMLDSANDLGDDDKQKLLQLTDLFGKKMGLQQPEAPGGAPPSEEQLMQEMHQGMQGAPEGGQPEGGQPEGGPQGAPQEQPPQE